MCGVTNLPVSYGFGISSQPICIIESLITAGLFSSSLGGFYDPVVDEAWLTTSYDNGSVAKGYHDQTFIVRNLTLLGSSLVVVYSSKKLESPSLPTYVFSTTFKTFL